jgi:transcriptional regulator with GAF, ATPase, and Fis domain
MADILAGQNREPAAAVGPDPQRIFTEDERQEQDRKNMLRALEAADWRVSGPEGAAALIGIRPSTFSDRMKKFAITRPH